jgi:DNA polymerase-4
MTDRSILHIRIDSFFASVERNRRRELAAKPVIVGRPRGNTSGVVVSASRDAMKLGVEEGMSIRQARRACPDAALVIADYALYRQVSEHFLDILASYSPLIEPDTLGSAYMDVTASRTLFGDAQRIASMIMPRVYEQLGLLVSIGCASNKLVARVASGVGKSFARIDAGSEVGFLAPLPIAVLDAVNGKMKKRLNELGVSTVGQLAMIPERLLVRQFGPVGSLISKQSRGIDPSQVNAAYPPEVINIEHGFDNALLEPVEVEEYLRRMTNEAVITLRKRNILAGEIMLVLFDDGGLAARPGFAIPDPDASTRIYNPRDSELCLSIYSRFKKPTDSAAAIAQALVKLLESVMRPGMEVSRVRIVLSELTPGAASQLCLIGDGERRHRLDRVVELVRARFGDGSVIFASSMAPMWS